MSEQVPATSVAAVVAESAPADDSPVEPVAQGAAAAALDDATACATDAKLEADDVASPSDDVDAAVEVDAGAGASNAAANDDEMADNNNNNGSDDDNNDADNDEHRANGTAALTSLPPNRAPPPPLAAQATMVRELDTGDKKVELVEGDHWFLVDVKWVRACAFRCCACRSWTLFVAPARAKAPSATVQFLLPTLRVSAPFALVASGPNAFIRNNARCFLLFLSALSLFVSGPPISFYCELYSCVFFSSLVLCLLFRLFFFIYIYKIWRVYRRSFF